MIALTLAILLPVAPALATPPAASPSHTAPPPAEAYVASVYDGDTFTLESGDKVRLRWVNTPELRPLEPYAEEARQLAYEFVHRKQVHLAVGPEERDGYGRLIAGVSTDAGDLSIALLEAGLAHVFIIPPEDANVAPLIAAQERARQARRGLWSSDAFQSALHLTSFHANAAGPDERNVNGEYFRVCNISAQPVDLSTWSVRDEDGLVFKLPAVELPAGFTATVHSGTGKDQGDPTRPMAVHLGSDTPVFNNDAARVELLGPDGRVGSLRVHGGH